MPISSGPIQQKIANAKQLTLDSTPTQGNLLIAHIGQGNGNTTQSTTVASITQSGVTWTKVIGQQAQNMASEIWMGVVGASPNLTLTVVLTDDSKGNVSLNVSEWSGLATTGQPDASLGTQNANSTAPATGSVTPTAGTEVLVVGTAAYADTVAPTAGPTGGFTALANALGSISPVVPSAYRVEASASGSYGTGWTIAKARWAATIAAFKAEVVPTVTFAHNIGHRPYPYAPGVPR